MTNTDTTLARPEIRRVRHELKRRRLTITRAEQLTPHMIRVHLTGDDMADFASASPDDHLKCFFPNGDGEPKAPAASQPAPAMPDMSKLQNMTPEQRREFFSKLTPEQRKAMGGRMRPPGEAGAPNGQTGPRGGGQRQGRPAQGAV